MAIIHGLWTEPDGWSFEGSHWQVNGSKRHGEIARGGRRHPHIMFGGKGGPRLAALVARYGDEFNLNSASPRRRAGRLRPRPRGLRCRSGRDPGEIVYSAMTGVLVAETEDRPADPRRGPARRARPGAAQTAMPGWPSGAGAGSWARRTRPANASRALEANGHAAGDAPGLPSARPRPRRAHRARLPRPDGRRPAADMRPRPLSATLALSGRMAVR